MVNCKGGIAELLRPLGCFWVFLFSLLRCCVCQLWSVCQFWDCTRFHDLRPHVQADTRSCEGVFSVHCTSISLTSCIYTRMSIEFYPFIRVNTYKRIRGYCTLWHILLFILYNLHNHRNIQSYCNHGLHYPWYCHYEIFLCYHRHHRIVSNVR